jgi:tetratricopeptide (TPR) repeat protein
VSLSGFWILRGYSAESRAIVKAALALPPVQESDIGRAWALYAGSRLAERQSDLAEALKMLEACLELRRGLGNPVDIVPTLSTLSLVRLQTGDAAGAEVGEREALQILKQLGNRVGEAIGLLHLGQIDLLDADFASARTRLAEQAGRIARG